MVESGRPSGPPVVLVHGIGVSRRYFAPLVRELADRARVLAVDLPGFGGQPGPRVLSVPQHAQAVREALVARGVRDAVLVGHSMGCQVVAHLLREDPGLAVGAVLLGPTVDQRARSALRQGVRLLRDSALEPPGFVLLLAREYLRCGPLRYLATARQMLADRIEDVLPSATAPVLVLRGASDPIAPRRWTEQLAALAPSGRAVQASGGRHGVQWTHPGEVAQACLRLARA